MKCQKIFLQTHNKKAPNFTYSIKYGVPSSVKDISHLDGRGPRLEVLCARSRDFLRCIGGGSTSSGWWTGEDLLDDVSMLERLRRRFPSDDGCWPGTRWPVELVRLKGDGPNGSLGGLGVP